MEEVSSLYNSKTKCPVCESSIEFTKVKSRSIRLIKQDTDFCPWYEGENPVYYEAVICPECGYGAHVTTFEKINRFEKTKIKEKITPRWKKRSFIGPRTIEKALEAFKIALMNLIASEANKSEVAKICLRIAWLHRYEGDEVQEKKFLEHALRNYKMAYQGEDLSEGKFDEYVCMFIIGELSKRLGKLDESSQWLSRLITSYSDPNKKNLISNKLIETTRDLIQEIKDMKANQSNEEASTA
ncbi:MAG: DUF2225 domain-containing protein [Clostridiaceae bacterium]|nr:DUF2225 domain-containing protein [Clostridiaceae bacterium]